MNFKDSQEDDAIRPETQPVSPSLIDFTKQSIPNLRNYTSSDRKDVTPSALSTPSSSYSARTGYKARSYMNMNGAEGITVDDKLNKEYNQIRKEGFSIEDNMEESKGDKKDNTSKQIQQCCKYAIVLLVMLAGIAGVIVVIVTNNDKKYPLAQQQRQQGDKCDISIPESIKYQHNVSIGFNCTFEADALTAFNQMKVTFDPKYRYSSERKEKFITINGTNFVMTMDRWNIRCNLMKKELRCAFLREAVRCDSGGKFSVFLYNGVPTLTKEVEFDVEGEVSKVDLNLNQTIDERTNSSIFDITCSATSACTPTTIWLFSQKDGQTERRYDINFTCIIRYNVQDGTSVNCTGSIPGSLLQSFGTMLCRPDLNDSMEAEAKQAVVKAPLCVGDECTFTCPDEEADIYYIDPLNCKIFHRCAKRQLYSGPCANSTYFNPETCSCDHVDKIEGCDNTGQRTEKLKNTRCGEETGD